MKNLVTLIMLFFLSSSLSSQSKNMRLLGTWTDTNLATNAAGYTYNEVFGFEMKGVEYAVLASTQGAHIIDITNPSAMVEVDFVPAKYQGNVTHRDYDVRNGYLYMVCDQAASSLQIADLSFLPDSVSVVYDSDALIVRSHNIFIDSAHEILYSCGGSKITGSNELRMIDISNPLIPTLITDLGDDVSWWSSFVGYVHDIYVRDNIAYTNDEDAMHIIDLNNPSSPIILGTLSSYLDQGYNHSGYLADDDSTYIMCDETHGKRVKAIDVGNPATILVTDLEGTGIRNSQQIAHNPIIKGDYAYVSYYYDGVQVFDITDKYNMTNVGYYDTYQGPNGGGGEGCWGVYPLLKSGKILASDRRAGLFVLEHLPEPIISFDTNRTTYSEGDGQQTVHVSLSNEFLDTVKVTVNIDTSSTATLNMDYTTFATFPLELVFAPGITSDSIQFTLTNDIDIETTETILFTLSNAVNGEIGEYAQDTITITENDFVGIDENERDLISVFPNPVTKGANVNFTERVNFTLVDVSGKVIMNDKAKSFSTNQLSSGVYVIHYSNKSVKLIVN
ncbi:MAG: choice-of-anchor B family protein [Flavobacteriales bacterium]